MKMLGNALLSAAIVATPALAKDVERNSHVLNNHYWQPSTIMAVQERQNAPIPKVLEGVAPCSPSDVVAPRGGMDGERVMSDEEVVDARYRKVDDLLSFYEREKDGRLKDRKDDVINSVQSEFLQLKLSGEDVFSHYQQQGGVEFENVRKHIIGITNENYLSMPAGVNDYVTGKKLNVGQVMVSGCVVALPDEPERAIAYEVNGFVNGVSMSQLDKTLRPDVAKTFKRKFDTNKHFAYATNFDAGSAEGHSYVHMDAFASDEQHIISTFFHELKHVHSDDRSLILENASAELNSENSGVDYHKNNTEIEVRAMVYGMAKIGQSFYMDGNGDADFVDYADRILKYQNEAIIFETADMITLSASLKDNGVSQEVFDSLNSVRVQKAFNNEDACTGLIGEQRVAQEKINECLFRVKNPYNPVVAMNVFKEVVVNEKLDLGEMSDKQISALVDDSVSSAMYVMDRDRLFDHPTLQGLSDDRLEHYTHLTHDRMKGVDAAQNHDHKHSYKSDDFKY